MWEMAKSSMSGFLRGKLFANNAHVAAQAAIGFGLTAAALVVLVKLHLPLLAAAAIAAFAGGMLQPRLFKNLKYQ